ncbi:MarR family transcriptional regulator [Micromonospora sp. CPCC 205558]|uniref:MarR family transcriptional regulator n=1 Tax=Micromonospora sp. CPCC 205558 TaxID=3122403 RepID=UPI002FEECA62
MDNTTDQSAAPSALDRVAAALATLGQDTAAAIAQRAGVGYSTATKRLRSLAEAGQAEPLRADDGRTLWQHVANAATSTDGGPPAATTDARRDPPSAVTDDNADEAHGPDEVPGPAEAANTASVASPDEGSTSLQPDDERLRAPDSDAGRPALQDPPAQPDRVPDASTTTPAEAGEASPADAENPPAADASGQADSAPSLDPGGSDDTVVPSSPSEALSASDGGKPRRSKGSLRRAILDVLEAHPGQPFKTSQLCKAIDQAKEGTDSAKASAGAVVNAVHKLVTDGVAVQIAERPATFQLAPATT